MLGATPSACAFSTSPIAASLPRSPICYRFMLAFLRGPVCRYAACAPERPHPLPHRREK